MKEIVSLAIGSCGNQIANRYWEEICGEHGITAAGQRQQASDLYFEEIGAYFNETSKRYTPRTVLADLDPASLDSIRTSAYGQLFDPNTFISKHCGTDSNWGRGFYQDGRSISDDVMKALRREVEKCERLQGFQLTHSLGGGTGSGLGSLLMQRIKEEYCDSVVSTYSVFPSDKVSSVEVEPYNCIFALSHLTENAEIVTVLDNEALCSKSSPQLEDLNQVIGQVMNAVTAPLRYSSRVNSTLLKTKFNLIPFPRVHYLTPSFASTQPGETVSALVQTAFDNSEVAPDSSSHFTMFGAAATFRGAVSSSASYKQCVKQAQDRYHLCEWIPDNIKTEVLPVPQKDLEVSVGMLINTASIKYLVGRVSTLFTDLFRDKTLIAKYLETGMDEMEFTEAESNANDLVSEYTPCTGCYDDEDEEEYDDEEGV
jgi:tubulin beta